MSTVVIMAVHAFHIEDVLDVVLIDKYRDSIEYRDTFARYLS